VDGLVSLLAALAVDAAQLGTETILFAGGH
jgi:hypothetical protein